MNGGIKDRSESIWRGYRRCDFTLGGRSALVVEPITAAPGNPWVWRTEFFDAFAGVDMAMLAMGWRLAYFMVSNMYGCPESLELMRGFQAVAEDVFTLAGRAALFGFSRGGLYAFNYAARYPEKVAALYLDAPALDIRRRPDGGGTGWSDAEWEECKRVYGLTEETAQDFRGNPLDKVREVAAAAIPIIVVAGGADGVVPYAEHGGLLVERYRGLGGIIEAIVKPGCGHHPHGLENPAPVVDFLLKYSHLAGI